MALIVSPTISRRQGLGYNLILARPTPPPSDGKVSFMRGYLIVEPTVRAPSIRRGCDIARNRRFKTCVSPRRFIN